jgi:hypothetical protein
MQLFHGGGEGQTDATIIAKRLACDNRDACALQQVLHKADGTTDLTCGALLAIGATDFGNGLKRSHGHKTG